MAELIFNRFVNFFLFFEFILIVVVSSFIGSKYSPFIGGILLTGILIIGQLIICKAKLRVKKFIL